MTPEQQRIAIAEACPFVKKYGKGELLWRVCGRAIYFDPLNDLNAMHEAEAHAIFPWWVKRERYEETINSIMGDRRPWHATAAQRAEAFLRTLNLWNP